MKRTFAAASVSVLAIGCGSVGDPEQAATAAAVLLLLLVVAAGLVYFSTLGVLHR